MKQKAFAVVAVAVIIFVIGLVSVWAQQPLLIASLGAAAFSQVMSPEKQSAKPYHVGMSQIIGAIAAMVAVLVTHGYDAPIFFGGQHLALGRVAAVTLGCVLALLGVFLLKVQSPTGGATAVFVAAGLETTDWAGAGRVLAGIVLVVGLGEACRRIALKLQD